MSEQPDLFSGKVEPAPLPFGGQTYDREKDCERMTAQLKRVFEAMKDGKWRTLATIHELSRPGSEAATSSRIRDLRKPAFGGYTVESKRGESGAWFYRLLTR